MRSRVQVKIACAVLDCEYYYADGSVRPANEVHLKQPFGGEMVCWEGVHIPLVLLSLVWVFTLFYCAIYYKGLIQPMATESARACIYYSSKQVQKTQTW